jgi:UDP-sugar transporter A1/2/3
MAPHISPQLGRVPLHSAYARQRGVRAQSTRARIAATASTAASGGGGGDEEAIAARKRTRLRAFVLTLLVFQNAASALLTRWTRVQRVGVPMYYDSTAVLLTELLKVPMCAAMMLYTQGGAGAARDLKAGFSNPREVLALAVPAVCYTLQNILFYIALTSLSASTYQVLSQTKTLATACFWVTMLGGRLVPRQWAALSVLVAGVSAVQLDGAGGGGAATGSQILGVLAVLLSSLLSGFANVYFERLVKTTPTSIWVRNLQLATFGIPQALVFMLKDGAAIGLTGAFLGFDRAVWTAVALKALGGLVVASTVKYADSLLKSFATAISIIVTCVVSVRTRKSGGRERSLGSAPRAARPSAPPAHARPRAIATRACGSRQITLYGTIPSTQFVWGVALVISSVFLYNVKKPPTPTPMPPTPPTLATAEAESPPEPPAARQ